jgi:predicted  nucleic acid-binding Zn-ribbon protein
MVRWSVDQQLAETNIPKPVEENSIEGALKTLWEKTRRAGEAIARLREEKMLMQTRVGELEREVMKLRKEISQKEELVAQVKAAQFASSNDGSSFTHSQRLELINRVKELLAKIDPYL